MKLSDRLSAIADMVETGTSLVDIGTDHGYLPIHLMKEGICSKVILTDISPASAQKAAEDCSKLDPGREYDIREGDGLTVLNRGEVDTVVIAGMGGILMTQIMERDPLLTQSFDKFILQPRRHAGYLRHWLASNGYGITKETLVREGKFICEIISTGYEGPPGEDIGSFEEKEALYSYPEMMVEQNRSLARELLGNHREKLCAVLEIIGDSSDGRRKTVEKKVERIDYLLEKYQ